MVLFIHVFKWFYVHLFPYLVEVVELTDILYIATNMSVRAIEVLRGNLQEYLDIFPKLMVSPQCWSMAPLYILVVFLMSRDDFFLPYS